MIKNILTYWKYQKFISHETSQFFYDSHTFLGLQTGLKLTFVRLTLHLDPVLKNMYFKYVYSLNPDSHKNIDIILLIQREFHNG